MPSGIYTRTKEIKERISVKLKGRKLSKKHKQHISEGSKGRIWSKKSRDKLRDSVTKYKISKKYLIEQYVTIKKSMSQISRELHCSRSTIKYNLLKYGIPIRDKKDCYKSLTHHIDLDTRNNNEDNLLHISISKHNSIHRKCYDYLVCTNQIKTYITWFTENYGLN